MSSDTERCPFFNEASPALQVSRPDGASSAAMPKPRPSVSPRRSDAVLSSTGAQGSSGNVSTSSPARSGRAFTPSSGVLPWAERPFTVSETRLPVPEIRASHPFFRAVARSAAMRRSGENAPEASVAEASPGTALITVPPSKATSRTASPSGSCLERDSRSCPFSAFTTGNAPSGVKPQCGAFSSARYLGMSRRPLSSSVPRRTRMRRPGTMPHRSRQCRIHRAPMMGPLSSTVPRP